MLESTQILFWQVLLATKYIQAIPVIQKVFPLLLIQKRLKPNFFVSLRFPDYRNCFHVLLLRLKVGRVEDDETKMTIVFIGGVHHSQN